MKRRRKWLPRPLRVLPHLAITHVVLALLRALLGVAFIGTAVMFLRAMTDFSRLIPVPFNLVALGEVGVAHVIVIVHIAGGLLLILGMLTRWAAAVQIPIMLGAIVLVDFSHGSFASLSIWFTLAVGLGSLFFAIVGGGRWSIDTVVARERRAEEDAARGAWSGGAAHARRERLAQMSSGSTPASTRTRNRPEPQPGRLSSPRIARSGRGHVGA